MSDLIERLRRDADRMGSPDRINLAHEAADALEAAEAKLAAIAAAHRMTGDGRMEVWCSACGYDSSWPCGTRRILHPEEDK